MADLKRLKIIIVSLLIILIPNLSSAQYDSLFFDGINRTFLLHFPPSYNNTDTFPLVIAMHGGLGSADNLQDQSQLSIKADEENFIVVYPEGVQNGIFNIRTWNAGWCCGYASSANVNDVGFINYLLDTLLSQYQIDVNRVYATGMSNGGFMAYRIACELSSRIAAVAPVACSMSMQICSPERPVPIIHIHSYIDSNIPYLGGIGDGVSNHYNPPLDSVFNVWASLNGCISLNDTIENNSQYTFIKWNNCDCQTEIHYYISQDGGHSWAGGNSTIIGDPVSNYLNANDLMWDFFLQHTLDCNSSGIVELEEIEYPFNIYPNPINKSSQVAYSLIIPQKLTLEVYDLYGNLAYNVFSERQHSKGNYTVPLNKSLMPGAYICILRGNKTFSSNKIIILK